MPRTMGLIRWSGTALKSKDSTVDDEQLIREMAATVDLPGGFAIRDVQQRRFRYVRPGPPKILGVDPAAPVDFRDADVLGAPR